jgi:hypothetical protein
MPALGPQHRMPKWAKTQTVLEPRTIRSRAEQENMHATRLTFSTIGPRTYSAIRRDVQDCRGDFA